VDAPRLTTALLSLVASATLIAAGLSLLLGALSTTIALGSLIAGAVIGVAAFRARGRTEPRPFTPIDWIAWAILGVVAVRQFGWLVFARNGVVLTWNAFNYGDLPLHWTYIRFFANGAPFWPADPIFTGHRLQYPFGMDLFNALWLKLGVPLGLGLVVTGLVAAAALGATLSRWGGALAILALVLSGGVATSDLEWKNLFLALVVPQRGFLFALPAGLCLLADWRERLLRGRGDDSPQWIGGLLWGAMPLFHLHSFLFLSLIFGLWTLAGRRYREAWPVLAWALIPATWGVLMVTDSLRAASLVGWSPGWVIGSAAVLPFLAQNFGLTIPLALWLLIRAVRGRDRETRWSVLPAVAVWLSLFLVKLAPWAWDNTKVMIWCYLLLIPALAEALGSLRLRWAHALLAAWLLPGAVTMVEATFGAHGYDVYDIAEEAGVCGALQGLPMTARIAAAQTFNHPVALCGHPLVAGYSGHLWSHGIAPVDVEVKLRAVLMGAPGWEHNARSVQARYLFWGRREADAFAGSTRAWEQTRPLVGSGAWGRLYDLGD
jgi:hypothetical protein